jgi:hypothetical protein
MAELEICTDPTALGTLFADADPAVFPDWDRHPLYGRFGRALGGAIDSTRHRHTLCHFAVVDGNDPVLLAPATCDGTAVSMFGHPLVLALRTGLGRKRQKQAFAAAFAHLRQIATDQGAASVRILGADSGGALDVVDLACIDQHARPESHVHAVLDARQPEAEIHRQLRDSYRSLVNWGRQQLKQVYVNAESPDRGQFELYPSFHERVAGAAHYNNAYWDTVWTEIVAGRGELSLGLLADGRLVTGTLVLDAGNTAYYASGVYERELFDKPLGHFPVFDSILRAGARGLVRYDLGEIFPDGAASGKEVQIGFFKKGFSSSFLLRTVWVVDTAPNAAG